MRSVPVAQPEVAGGQPQRIAGEYKPRPRAGQARPHNRPHNPRVRRHGGRIIPAGHVHFDIAEAALFEMRPQRRDRASRREIRRAMRQNGFAAWSGYPVTNLTTVREASSTQASSFSLYLALAGRILISQSAARGSDAREETYGKRLHTPGN